MSEQNHSSTVYHLVEWICVFVFAYAKSRFSRDEAHSKQYKRADIKGSATNEISDQGELAFEVYIFSAAVKLFLHKCYYIFVGVQIMKCHLCQYWLPSVVFSSPHVLPEVPSSVNNQQL